LKTRELHRERIRKRRETYAIDVISRLCISLSLSLYLPTRRRRRPFQRTPIRGRLRPPTHRAGTRQNVCTRKTVDEQLPPPLPPLFYNNNILLLCVVFFTDALAALTGPVRNVRFGYNGGGDYDDDYDVKIDDSDIIII